MKGDDPTLLSHLPLESLLLVTALSVDAFAACFAYGASHIQIPPLSAVLLDLICTGFLLLSLGSGALVRPLLPAGLPHILGALLLFPLGLLGLGGRALKSYIRRHPLRRQLRFSSLRLHLFLEIYADPEAADRDASGALSPAEAVWLAVALSLDGLAVGFGAAMSAIPPFETALLSLGMGMAAVLGGCALGNRLARRFHHNLSWMGGVLLMLLALCQLG